MSYIERGPIAGDPYYDAPDNRDLDDASGWLMFAALMIFFVGAWNVFEGFAALFSSGSFTGAPAFGTLTFWSVIWIGLGVLQIAVAFAIFAGRGWARWLGILLVGASALVHMVSIPAYPLWSVFVLVIDIVILYTLAVRWNPDTVLG